MTTFDNDLFADSAGRMSVLGNAISEGALEGVAREVVNRLAARRQMPDLAENRDYPPPRVIDSLCDALVAADPAPAREMMRRFQREGVSLDVLYGRYLAAAAGRLGHLWDTDCISFTRVTVGVGRICDIVRLLRDHLPAPVITRAEPVLFATVPGERHGVGMQMAAELFRQNGWDVHVLSGATHEEIMTELEQAQFLVIGLSSGGRGTADALARLIHAVRIVHPQMYILVSGKIVSEEADLIAAMAPDGAVATVQDALDTMEALARH